MRCTGCGAEELTRCVAKELRPVRRSVHQVLCGEADEVHGEGVQAPRLVRARAAQPDLAAAAVECGAM
jgi:hypothetical protein